MKFALLLDESMIYEWTEFYINYKELKAILKPLKLLYEDAEKNKTKSISSFNTELDVNLIDKHIEIAKLFREALIIQLNKVYLFYTENLNYYNKRINKIYSQLNHIRINHEFLEHKPILEAAIKELYKEINMIKSYLELNHKAEEKILKKFNKYAKVCLSTTILEDITESLPDYSLDNLHSCTVYQKIVHKIEKTFQHFFYEEYGFKCTHYLKEYIESRDVLQLSIRPYVIPTTWVWHFLELVIKQLRPF